MVLARGDSAVWGAEHLLAALECCGVDDARIEIEGGKGKSRNRLLNRSATLNYALSWKAEST